MIDKKKLVTYAQTVIQYNMKYETMFWYVTYTGNLYIKRWVILLEYRSKMKIIFYTLNN